MTPPILEVRDVVKTFGGIRAVDRCTLSVRPGTLTGLIGPNGAGKSTLFNAIVGLYAPDAGEIVFDGQPITGLLPHEVVHRGLIKTFQIPREFRNMTVLENLLVSGPPAPGERFLDYVRLFRGTPWTIPNRWKDLRGAQDEQQHRAEEVLATVGLAQLRDEYAKNLSGGQKKLLELARVLMARPKMVLLDEPVAGVNLTLTQKLLQVIEDLRQKGLTFFLIEHDMNVVMSRCEWIIVMHQGRTLTEGVAAEIKANPAVVESYLGG